MNVNAEECLKLATTAPTVKKQCPYQLFTDTSNYTSMESTEVWRKKSDVSSDSGDDFELEETMNLGGDSSLSDASTDGKNYI